MHSEYIEHVTSDPFGLQYLCYLYKYDEPDSLRPPTTRSIAGNTIHNIYGPALQSYYLNGNLRSTQYYVCGELHRVVWPALTNYLSNGSVDMVIFYLRNKLHNVTGPATIAFYEDMIYVVYYTNGIPQKREQIDNSQTERIAEFRNLQNRFNSMPSFLAMPT